MEYGVKSKKQEGSLARKVKDANELGIGNIAAERKAGRSRFTLLRFENDHVGRFHYDAENLAWTQFEKASGRRHLIDNSLRMTVARA